MPFARLKNRVLVGVVAGTITVMTFVWTQFASYKEEKGRLSSGARPSDCSRAEKCGAYIPLAYLTTLRILCSFENLFPRFLKRKYQFSFSVSRKIAYLCKLFSTEQQMCRHATAVRTAMARSSGLHDTFMPLRFSGFEATLECTHCVKLTCKISTPDYTFHERTNSKPLFDKLSIKIWSDWELATSVVATQNVFSVCYCLTLWRFQYFLEAGQLVLH